MKRLAAALLFGLSVSGCCSTTPAFFDGVARQWGAIGPRYRAYIEADDTLEQRTKDVRLMDARLMDILIEKEGEKWQ